MFLFLLMSIKRNMFFLLNYMFDLLFLVLYFITYRLLERLIIFKHLLGFFNYFLTVTITLAIIISLQNVIPLSKLCYLLLFSFHIPFLYSLEEAVQLLEAFL